MTKYAVIVLCIISLYLYACFITTLYDACAFISPGVMCFNGLNASLQLTKTNIFCSNNSYLELKPTLHTLSKPESLFLKLKTMPFSKCPAQISAYVIFYSLSSIIQAQRERMIKKVTFFPPLFLLRSVRPQSSSKCCSGELFT